jgi:hypothetical protein
MKNKYITIIIIVLVIVLIATKVKADYMSEANNENEAPGGNFTIGPAPYTGVPGSKNFTLDEFHCKDGSKVPAKYYGNLQQLINQLQIIREQVGRPILINSAYRSLAHNTKIGGAKNSQHLTASAADIVIVGLSAREVQNKLLQLINAGVIHNGGLGSYSSFTHYDIGPARRWN